MKPHNSSSISVQEVTKTFRIYQEQFKTIKERLLHFGKIPFQELDAIKNISFEVPTGTTTGILGHNGSGKSTLLKCIAGTLTPSSGEIAVNGRMAALLELGAGFHPELTGRENLYIAGSILGLNKNEISSRLSDIVEFAELEEFIDNQMKYYSSGMFARLGFALAANINPEVLLIDEVLSVGDEAFQYKCLNQIHEFSKEGVTILFVTHDVDLASSICDELIVLDHGEMVTQGNPEESASTYRKILHTTEPSKLDNELIGTGEIRFDEVTLENNGRQISTIKSGDNFIISIKVTLNQPVEDLVFAYSIRAINGEIVNSSNTHILGLSSRDLPSKLSITFAFNEVSLMDGLYDIDVGAHSLDGAQLYCQSNSVKKLAVIESSKSAGILDLPVTAKIDTL